MNTQCNEVFRNEKEISLREMEYRILLLMMENPKKVILGKKIVYESLWEEPFLYSSGNTVMVHIRRLRMKIEDDPQKAKDDSNLWGKGISPWIKFCGNSLTGKIICYLMQGY